MPANRNALIRYKTLDKCFQNRYRKWTLDDLIDAVSEVLYEYEGIDKGVSRRTVQGYIQMMRSDKLGYNAPIIVEDKKYYTYEDPHYSITNIPLTDQDLTKLYDAVDFMKQFQGFSYFRELDGMVQKLEDHIYAQKTDSEPVIDFEKNENLKGLDFLDVIHKSILQKKAMKVTYKSFKARQENTFLFYGYWLKEFRNRWFVVGVRKEREGLLNLALDRIIGVEVSELPYRENKKYQLKGYYKDVIGASVSPTLDPMEVVLFLNHKHAPYILTKPLHSSQKEIKRDHFGVTISLQVQHNYELEKEILSYGEVIQVLKPDRLKRIIKDRIIASLDNYNTEIRETGLKSAKKRLEHKGFAIVNSIFSTREVNKIRSLLDQKLSDEAKKKSYFQRQLINTIPELRELIFNKNLIRIVDTIDEKAFLTKATFISKDPQSNWYVAWHQDNTINVIDRVEVDGYLGWTSKDEIISVIPPEEISQHTFAIRIHLDETTAENGAVKVLSGSHKKRLSDDEIKTISENSVSYNCEVGAGGIHLMRPLLLHASSKVSNQKKRRVIHLEFCSEEIDQKLEWLEK